MANILVINGPNLNLLGKRELNFYGKQSASELHSALSKFSGDMGHTLHYFQSNFEGELIERIHAAIHDQTDFILINPAAFTHTSIALRDALLACEKPFIEIHISNIFKREPFRQHSYFSDIAVGVISGLGTEGYLLGIQYADSYLQTKAHRDTCTTSKLTTIERGE